MTRNDPILTVLSGIERDFSNLDIENWTTHFHVPCLLLANGTAIAVASESELVAYISPVVTRLRAAGFARTELMRSSSRILDDTNALACTLWRRLDRDEQEIERLAATYAFINTNGGWKIAMLMVHSAETKLSFA